MQHEWTFKIVIAYENFAVAIHAKEMSERVAVEMDWECDAWSFERLAAGPVREHAITAAAKADMIIIAARRAAELPDAVRSWIEEGLRQRGSGPAALVALLYDEWTGSGEPPSVCTYLQQTAEKEHVDFFCNLGPWLGRDAIESSHQLPQLGFTMGEEGAPEHSAPRRWRSND